MTIVRRVSGHVRSTAEKELSLNLGFRKGLLEGIGT